MCQVPRRASSCARLHKPTAEDLLDLVKRSAPAVLTGLLDGWPAVERWDHDYLRRHLGDRSVTVSVSEGFFDVPEDPAIWGAAERGLTSVVARPAHEPMSFSDALRRFDAAAHARPGAPEGNLSYYLEYFPMEAMRTPLLRADLRAGPPCSAHERRSGAWARSSAGEAAGQVCAAGGGGAADSSPADGGAASPLAASPLLLDAEAVPRLSAQGEPGELAIADWLMPRKHLLWIGSGGTVGSTHYDPYESAPARGPAHSHASSAGASPAAHAVAPGLGADLMLVIAGSKTFHVANPDDGRKVGAFTRMAEGHFALRPGGGGAEGAAGAPAALERPAASVTEPTELHHYAAGVLSRPAHEQPHVPRLKEATVFNCTAHAGEVLYLPAYWWHEVHSAPGAPGRPSIGINWFFESYYQRIFPNQSWDRSLHYLMLGAENGIPLRTPFPPREPAPREAGAPPSQPAAPRGRRPTSFAERLQQQRAAAS